MSYFLPKIKRCEMKSKIILDPSDFQDGIPLPPLPELTSKGDLLISLKPSVASHSKLTEDCSLKLNVKYQAEVVHLLDRYVEVQLLDGDNDLWIGQLWGFTVRGSGGEGKIRGCIVKAVEGETIVVEAIAEAGRQQWKNFIGKVDRILSNRQ